MDSETCMLCTRKEFSLTRRNYMKYRSLRSKILRKPGDVPHLRRNERHGPHSDEVPSGRARNGMEARERSVDEKGLIRTPTLTFTSVRVGREAGPRKKQIIPDTDLGNHPPNLDTMKRKEDAG